MRSPWPLVGRVEELGFISECLRPRRRPRGVVLAGAAGVGKTRLAREALKAVGDGRGTTRWVSATTSASGLPLGAFAGLLGAFGGEPDEMLRRAREALLVSDGPEDVVVAVDDAHLLDDLSALLVHDLVLNTPAGVVVTVRTGEPARDPVTALWKDELLDRLEVQPLSEEETGALVEQAVGGPVESASAVRLWELTRGNALFLHHVVEGELEAGRLREVAGVWRWWSDLEMSPTLTELIEARMGRLPRHVSTVADLLALGQPLDLTVLAGLTGLGAVEAAEGVGVVDVQPGQAGLQARLAHPLYGEVRRARMGELRARRLRGQIAAALVDQGRSSDEEILRRAVLVLGSDLEPDPDLLIAAARLASRLADVSLAERLARTAAQAGGRFEARLLRSYMLSWLGRGVEAERELSALTDATSGGPERLQVVLPRVANLFWTLGRPSEAEAMLETALADTTDDTARRCLGAFQAAFHFFLGRPETAVHSARRALDGAPLPEEAAVVGTWGLLGGLGVAGRVDELREAAAAADVHRASHHGYLRVGLTRLHLRGLRLAGLLDEMERVAGSERDARSEFTGPTLFWVMGFLGETALARGQLPAAVRRLREARVRQAGTIAMGWDYECLIQLTLALAMSGDHASARRTLARLEADAHPAFVFVEPEVVLARAWVAASEGSVTEATQLTHEAAEIAAAHGQPADVIVALHTAARFGDRTVADRLADLARRVEGPRAAAAVAHAAALAADDADGLGSASLQLEQMGDLVAAADASAQAAAVYAHQGHRAGARGAASRAHQMAEACGGARSPALVAAARPLPLTRREREIATMAARGLTNRQIADKLVVSVRTVEGHLYRAGAKLGISRRSQLADLLDGT